jgi:hypothetical protein
MAAKGKSAPPSSYYRLEELLAAEGESLLLTAIELGRSGDVGALRAALDRILPPPKDRPVTLDLAQIENVADLLKAIGVVIADVARGRLTPSEGSTLVGMLSAMRSAFETCEMETRLRAIELALPDGPGGSHAGGSSGGIQ